MNELTPTSVEHLSNLARIALTSEEQGRFVEQLESVVEYVGQLQEVDTASITQVRGVTGLVNRMAEDQERSADDQLSVTREVLLSGAPVSERDYIVVRAVLGEGSEESS